MAVRYDAPPEFSSLPPGRAGGCRRVLLLVFVIVFMIVWGGFAWLMLSLDPGSANCTGDAPPPGAPVAADVARGVADTETFLGYDRPADRAGRSFAGFDGVRLIRWRLSAPRRDPAHAGWCGAPVYPLRADYTGVRHFADGGDERVAHHATIGLARDRDGGWEAVALR